MSYSRAFAIEEEILSGSVDRTKRLTRGQSLYKDIVTTQSIITAPSDAKSSCGRDKIQLHEMAYAGGSSDEISTMYMYKSRIITMNID